MAVTEESVRVWSKNEPERVACRVFLSADQADLTADAWNKVNFNDETYDWGQNFDNTTDYHFNVPVTGLYAVSANVTFVTASVIADKSYSIGIFVSTVQKSQNSGQPSMTGLLTLSIYDEIYLTKDQYVDVEIFPTSAGANTVDIDGDTSGLYTYCTIRLLSKEGVKQ